MTKTLLSGCITSFKKVKGISFESLVGLQSAGAGSGHELVNNMVSVEFIGSFTFSHLIAFSGEESASAKVLALAGRSFVC